MIQNDRSVPVATIDVNAVVSVGVGVVLSESVDAWLRFEIEVWSQTKNKNKQIIRAEKYVVSKVKTVTTRFDYNSFV